MIARLFHHTAQILKFSKQELRNVYEDAVLLSGMGERQPAFRHCEIAGSSIVVRADEDSGREIYFGQCEINECNYLSREIRTTDICVDVGGNAGFYSLLFSSLATSGQVHAFEPIELNYHLLCMNVLANKRSNVFVNNCALADINGELDFLVTRDSGYSSFIDTERREVVGRTRVNALTLDAYIHEKQLTHIDCLKVDVEGAEEKVLLGAAELLGDPKRKPRLILLELYEPMLNKYNTSIEAILSRMKDYGYTPFVWTGKERLAFQREHYSELYNVFFSTG